MSHLSESTHHDQRAAVTEIAAQAHARLGADPAWHAEIDQHVAAIQEDFAGCGGHRLDGDVARAYLMGSVAMLVALTTHVVRADASCFNRHVDDVWDRAVVMADNAGAPL